MNDTIEEEPRQLGGGGSPLLRNSPTRKIESNTTNTPTSTSHHPYLTHRTSTNTSQSSLSSHGSGGGGGKIRSRSSSNSKLSNAAGHGGYGSLTKRKKLAHCLTVPELSTSARQQQQHGGIRRSSRNRLRDELSRDNVPPSSVGQSSRRRSNRLLAAKSTPLIFGRGNSSIGSFGTPSRRISDYDNASNQQNEEWGVIQEQQQQQPLVSLSNAMLSGQQQQHQRQHRENPLLTRLLDAKGCSVGVSIGDSRLTATDKVQPLSSTQIEESNVSFGTLAKAKVRAEKKAEEEDVIKCIDSSDKGVDEANQDDKMLIDEEEEEETSKENHKPQASSSSSLPAATTSTSRSISTTSKWSQSIVNSCPWWMTSFLPSASTESQAFLMSPSSSIAVDNDEQPSSATTPSSSRPRSNSSSNNKPHKQLRFSTQQDIIPSPSYEITSTDLKNSWLLATNIPTTLSNIQMISAHRGITVSYSLKAASIVGKTSMVHIEPTQLINRINLSKDRYRLAVLEEQKRQREEERLAAAVVVDTAAEGEKEEMDEHDSDVGNDHESSSCNMDNVEKLGKVASIYSEWGVELALSRWWMER